MIIAVDPGKGGGVAILNYSSVGAFKCHRQTAIWLTSLTST